MKDLQKKQKRILFFVNDGFGLGHLQRISRIAETLQGEYFSCLIVSGYREMSWIVSKKCEYVYLPNLKILLGKCFDGLVPFISFGSQKEILQFRKSIFFGIVSSFKPDAIFTDYQPIGSFDELRDIIVDYPAKKYFIARGVIDSLDKPSIKDKNIYLEKYYHRIFIACDKRVCNFVEKYKLSSSLKKKSLYVGYVKGFVSKEILNQVRTERNIDKNKIWVVCSIGGGGRCGEKFAFDCLELSKKHPELYFDIILGPRNNFSCNFLSLPYMEYDNVRIYKENRYLNYLHAASDIVICPGSYNSLIESFQGDASVIVYHILDDKCDEPYIHTKQLRKIIDIESATTFIELSEIFRKVVQKMKNRNTPSEGRYNTLDYSGSENIKKTLCVDLEII